MTELNRVELTAKAADLLRELTGTYGPLMFHQSGGCCDGSSPMCYPDGDFMVSEGAVFIIPSVVESVPKAQYDVVKEALDQYDDYSGESLAKLKTYQKTPPDDGAEKK